MIYGYGQDMSRLTLKCMCSISSYRPPHLRSQHRASPSMRGKGSLLWSCLLSHLFMPDRQGTCVRSRSLHGASARLCVSALPNFCKTISLLHLDCSCDGAHWRIKSVSSSTSDQTRWCKIKGSSSLLALPQGSGGSREMTALPVTAAKPRV